MSIENCKKAAAEKAASLIQDGMIIGLGSGSTASYFIQAIASRIEEGLTIQAVASSNSSHLLAQKHQLPLIDPNSSTTLDLYIDGADEIDPEKRMIKGGGGAFLREKILAHSSRELLIIIDETKLVSKLGAKPLPIELLPFGLHRTLHHCHELGYFGKIRTQQDGSYYLTDNHNYLYDIQLPTLPDIAEAHHQLRSIPGVIETGFFPNRPGRVIIGFENGSVVTH